MSLAVVLLLPVAFSAQQENEEEVPRQIARLKGRRGKKGGERERGRVARASVSRPNSHCIPETAGYYELETFLPSFFPPFLLSSSLALSHRLSYIPRLRSVSCVPARFSVCFLTGTNGSLEPGMRDLRRLRRKDCQPLSERGNL